MSAGLRASLWSGSTSLWLKPETLRLTPHFGKSGLSWGFAYERYEKKASLSHIVKVHIDLVPMLVLVLF